MDMRKRWAGFGLMAIILFIAGSAWSEMEQKDTMKRSGHRTVVGTVSKVTEHSILVKTEEGTIRNFAVKDAVQEGIARLKPGDIVTLELDEGNQVIDIEKGATSEKERSHSMVAGEVVSYDRVKKEVTLKMQTGESRSFRLKEAAASKMNSVKAGSRIVMEVDEENNMGSDFELR
jgi:hypothetical protein